MRTHHGRQQLRGNFFPLHAQGNSPTRSWSTYVLLVSLIVTIVVLQLTQWLKQRQMPPSGMDVERMWSEQSSRPRIDLTALRDRKAALERELAYITGQLAEAEQEDLSFNTQPDDWKDFEAKPDWVKQTRLLGENIRSSQSTSPPPLYPDLWPLPHSFSNENKTTFLLEGTSFLLKSNREHSDLIKQAFDRYGKLIFGRDWLRSSQDRSRGELEGQGAGLLKGLQVRISTDDETLQSGTSESYKLQVPAEDDGDMALIEADTVYGALRGLETFSQLCTRAAGQAIRIEGAPWKIEDAPRFQHRGLLIDSARHFLPVVHVKALIDSLPYAKLNVLHWHLVDSEAFHVETPSFPELWKGAYSLRERYTLEDLQEVVEYARLRGVRILPELDSPGHARSWGIGYPKLWPSPSCPEPLDPSKPITYEVLEGVLKDMASVFPEKMIHLGGDEVNTSCWLQVPHLQQWMHDQGFTSPDGSLDPSLVYDDFTAKVQRIVGKLSRTPVLWEEAFLNSLEKGREKFNGIEPMDTNGPFEGRELNEGDLKLVNGKIQSSGLLDTRMIVQVWNWENDGPAMVMAVNAGFQVILSKGWYLDYLQVPWQAFYKNDPHANMTEAEQRSLVLGGEACMWGETVDASNLELTVWPRLAAAAERLWSSEAITSHPQALEAALPRLESFRGLLLERGVKAGPAHGFGRAAPRYPGSYLRQ